MVEIVAVDLGWKIRTAVQDGMIDIAKDRTRAQGDSPVRALSFPCLRGGSEEGGGSRSEVGVRLTGDLDIVGNKQGRAISDRQEGTFPARGLSRPKQKGLCITEVVGERQGTGAPTWLVMATKLSISEVSVAAGRLAESAGGGQAGVTATRADAERRGSGNGMWPLIDHECVLRRREALTTSAQAERVPGKQNGTP